MRKRGALWILLLSLPLVSPPAAFAQTPPPPGAPKQELLNYWVDVMKAATAHVVVLDGEGRPIRETYGVSLGSPPRLVTRLTALEGAGSVEASFPNSMKVTGKSVVAYDPVNDIAVIDAVGPMPNPPEVDDKNQWRYVETLYVIPGPGMGPDWPQEKSTSPLTLEKLQVVPVTGDHPEGLPIMYPSGWWTGLTGRIEDETGSFFYITPKEAIIPTIFAEGPPVDLAEAARSAANHLDPKETRGLFVRAVCAGQSTMDEAMPFFNLALERDPEMAEIHFWMGRFYFREKKHAEAEVAYRKAARFKPEWEEAHQMAGSAANQLGNYDLALQIYDEGLKLNPQSTKIRINKWGALYNLGRTNEAIEVLKDALEIDPNSELAIFNLSMSYLRIGNRIEAESQYSRLRALGSSYAPRLRQSLDE